MIEHFRRIGLPAIVAAVIASPLPASAHHSFAMYDSAVTLKLDATVKDFQWSNPHALLWVLVRQDGKEPELWTVELPTSPGNLARMGWSKHSLTPGDRLTLEINPLRDGQHGGSFRQATLTATGQVLVAYRSVPKTEEPAPNAP